MRALTNYRVRRVVTAALWIVVVSSLALFAQAVGDNPGMRVTRTLSAAHALPESTFQVTLELKANADLQGVGLREHVPFGWLIHPVESAGAAFKRTEGEWIFGETIETGTTKYITYEVTVPSAGQLMSDPLPQCFTISGTYQTTVPSFETETEGESTIEIVSALPVGTAIAHLIPEQVAGSDIIDLRLSRWISEAQLQRALEFWQHDLPVPGTAGQQIDLAMMNHLAAQFETCTRADDALPLSIDPELNAMRTLETFLPCDSVLLPEGCLDPGQSARLITVNIEITSSFDAYGVGLKEWFPSAWKATPIEHDGFWYRPSASEWVYPTRVRAGETLEVIYQIEVVTTPFDSVQADAGCCGQAMTLVGETSSALECSVAPVLGEDTVTVSTCIPVMLAISRWDVESDRLNVRLSDIITFPQVQRAIQFWVQNSPVPHTCGYTVGYHTLKTIVAYWLSGTLITMPLSQDGVLPACGDSTEECETAACIDGWICRLAEMQDPTDFVGLPKPPAVVVDSGPDRVLTCAQPSVTLSAVTSGGVAPFTYEWRDSQAQTVGTAQTLSVDTPGTYTLIATSCGGCLAIDSVTVTEDYAQPIIAVSVSDILTGYVTTSEIAASISGGTEPFSVVWTTASGELVDDSLTLSVSEPGTYTISAIGANGCSGHATATVLQDIEPPSVQIDITPTLLVDAAPADAVLTCALPEIVLEGQVSGGRAPYILQWTDNQGITLGNLSALGVNTPGTYVLTATGANGVSANTSVDVDQDIEPPSIAVSSSGELTCAVTEVVLSTTVIDGRSPFMYQWTNELDEIVGTNPNLTTTDSGSYTVTVTGSNGCSHCASIIVEQNIEPPVVTPSVSGILTCAVTEVALSVDVSSGQTPYTIAWKDASGTTLGYTPGIFVSNPGTYTVIAIGDNGCSTEAVIAVEQDIEPPVVTASVDGVLTCVLTSVNLHANVVGGRAPLTFEWTNEAGQAIGSTVGLVVSSPGVYTIQVTGANGCTSSDRIIVAQDKEAPTVTVSVIESLTCSVTEVLLTSTVSGGHAPYVYEWSAASGSIVGQTSVLTVSTPGDYTLAVTGANGCSSSASLTVQEDTQPPVITILEPEQLNCAITEVAITADVSGGSAPYSYVWMDASENIISQSKVAAVSMPGIYSVKVTGSNGCQSAANVTVQQDVEAPTVTVSASESLTCSVTEVLLTSTVSGGHAPYTYEWTWAAVGGFVVGQTSVLTVSAPGCYTLAVTGANGCSSSASLTVQEDTQPPVITILEPEQLTCAITEVTVTADVSGGSAPYSYVWMDASENIISQSKVAAVSMPGIYAVKVTGSNGCQSTANVTVQQDVEPPIVAIPVPEVLTCALPEIILTAAVAGGRSPYIYSWTNGAGQIVGSTQQLTVATPGLYSVTVIGANGCEDSSSVTVQQDTETPAIILPVPEELTCSVSVVTLTSCISGGSTPYVYQWTDEKGHILGCASQLPVEEPGIYTLTVTGINGCASSASITVQQDMTPPCIALCEEWLLTCAEPTVFVDADICGGRGPFTYQWIDDCGAIIAITEDITLDMAGIYTLTVTGTNGCSSSRSVDVIDGINPPTVDAGPDQVLACVGDEILLDATMTGGICPYTFIWVDSCGEIVGTCEDLVVTLPGIYILTVHSADGCVGVDSVTVELL